jgi:hypothetical protein
MPPATRRRLERRGKRRDLIASGTGREDERWVKALCRMKRRKAARWHQNRGLGLSRDKSGGYPFTAQVVSGVEAA